MKHHLLLSLILSAAATLAGAAPQESAPPGFAEARQQFLAGVAGDAKARDAAVDAFHLLAAKHPGHPLLAVYEGAATTLQGRDAMMPWNKLSYAEKGANAIEKALAQLTPAHDEVLFTGSPESIETRLVAANSLTALPEFMHRGPIGRRAIESALASPALANCPPALHARVLLTAAKVAQGDQRKADETGLLKQVLAVAPQSPMAQQASARLKELGL
jgi:hypothetical protein